MKKAKLTFKSSESQFHFYASSAATWVTGEDPEALLERIRKEDGNKLGHSLWFVPVSEDTPYEIEMYAPQVEGAVYLGYYGYK